MRGMNREDIRKLVKSKKIKNVYGNHISFFEYEDIYSILRKYKDIKKVGDSGNVSTRWENVIFKWKKGNIYIVIDANSLYNHAWLEAYAPTKSKWEKFLNTHKTLKKYLKDLENKPKLKYHEGLDWYYRE